MLEDKEHGLCTFKQKFYHFDLLLDTPNDILNICRYFKKVISVFGLPKDKCFLPILLMLLV